LHTAKLGRAYKRTLRNVIGIFGWLGLRIAPVRSDKNIRRILLIYDFSHQPFSIGDILMLQEAGMVLCERHHATRIDFAAVFNPDKPVVNDPAFAHIDAESFLYHLSSILPAAQSNSRLGSLLLFDSHSSLEDYILANCERYRTWPSLPDYASGEYIFYRVIHDLLIPHFRATGSLPSLSPRPAAADWTRQFRQKHAIQKLVTVQIRKNPRNPARDSNMNAWLAFFQHTCQHYSVTFVVLCAHAEIDERMRACRNVVIAKDMGTQLEQDLALIATADAHMGASSGPGTIALFNSHPFCMFGFDTHSDLVGGLIEDGRHVRYPFSLPSQNWVRETETTAMLEEEFELLWAAIHQ
jgi:hypothetical protein